EKDPSIIYEKYGNALKSSAEALIQNTGLLSSNPDFTDAASEFLNAYTLFTRFDEFYSGPSSIKEEIDKNLTEKSGRNLMPDPEYVLKENEYENVKDFTIQKLKEICSDICSGTAYAQPLKSSKPCDYCDYRSVCENCIPTPGSFKRSCAGDKEKINKIRKGDTI
ncbi:MAG: hypothetical protein ACI4K7_00995, partial [Oscillospiraceae bacterium]